MPISRRAFVQASLTSAVLGGVAAETTNAALPKQVLEARSMGAAISAALGDDSFIDSGSVTVTVPVQAETGDVVPVSITTSLPRVESISLMADKNPVPDVVISQNGRPIVQADWSAGVARNPYLSFRVRGAMPGDQLRLTWKDNRGASDSHEITLT